MAEQPVTLPTFQDEPPLKWWEQILMRAPAVLGGFAAGMRGQQMPEHLMQPIREYEGRQQRQRLLKQWEPLFAKNPQLRALAPLVLQDPRFLQPFGEMVMRESQLRPVSETPGWQYAEGFSGPMTAPQPKTEPVPEELGLGTTSLTLPPPPEDVATYAEYTRAGERRALPPETEAAVGPARQRARELAEARAARLEAEKIRRGERLEDRGIRRGEHLEDLGTRERQHQENLLAATRQHYTDAMARNGVPDDKAAPVLQATTREEMERRYLQVLGTTRQQVTLEDGSTVSMAPQQAAAFERRALDTRLRELRVAEAERKTQEHVDPQVQRLTREIGTAEASLRAGTGGEEAQRQIFRLQVRRARIEHKDAPTLEMTRAQVLAKLKAITPGERQWALEKLKESMMHPDERTGKLTTGLTAEDVFFIERDLKAVTKTD